METNKENLTELKVLRATFFGSMLTVITCFLCYINYLLLGEFTFVVVLAALTSIWLKDVKEYVINQIKMALQNELFGFTKGTLTFRFCHQFIKLCIDCNFAEFVYTVWFEFEKRIS